MYCPNCKKDVAVVLENDYVESKQDVCINCGMVLMEY